MPENRTKKTAKPAAAAPAPTPAPTPAPAPDATENPLHKKLGFKSGAAVLLIAPPDDNDNPLLPLQEGFSTLATLDELDSAEGPFDHILVFARDRAALASAFGDLRDKLAPNGSLWIAWMKQSSSRLGGGVFADLGEDLVRRMALTHAMVDVKMLGLDRDWAALRLVRRKR